MTFKDLGLGDKVLKAISDCGYDEPTPIQAQAIPEILMTRDIIGLAQTGTGKTAAFTMPMIEILDGGRAKARMPRSLILSPTRELAAQIAENFDTYGKYCKLEKALLVGGTSMDKQIQKLERGVDVLIATPGRLIDLFERGNILMTDIKVLVIDEADRMMDMGFIPDIKKIISLLSPMRQTLLFSATMPDEIRKLVPRFLSNPKEISVAPPASTADNVKQYLVWSSPKKKDQVLKNIIEQEDVKNAFVFCNRKRDIAGLKKFLNNNNYKAGEMHGDMSQPAREKTLEEFKAGDISLMVCSDVAARGIDVDEVSHVFNYDVPMNADDYVHRVGRTGRAGNEGHAWTLATKRERENINDIEKLIGMNLEEIEITGSDKAKKNKSSNKKPSGKKPHTKNKQDNKRDEKKENKKAPEKSSPKKNTKNKNNDAGDITGFGDDIPGFFKAG